MKIINKDNMFGIICDANELKHIMAALGDTNNAKKIASFKDYQHCGWEPKPLSYHPYQKCEEALRKYYEGN